MFTSNREKKLWILASVMVAAIYSTLGLVRILAEELRNRELIDSLFVLGFFILIAAGIALGLRTKAKIGEAAVFVAMIAAFMMLALRMAVPEERTHLFEYAAVTIIVYEALRERSLSRPIRFPALWAFLIASTVGILDEFIQQLIPSRVFDPIDILFNVLASLVSVSGVAAVAALRRRSTQPPSDAVR